MKEVEVDVTAIKKCKCGDLEIWDKLCVKKKLG